MQPKKIYSPLNVIIREGKGTALQPARNPKIWPENIPCPLAAGLGFVHILWQTSSHSTLKITLSYYREISHLRGYADCPYSGRSIHADELDEQIAALIQSLRLTATWEQDVRKLLKDEQGLYEGEEYQYWKKVNGLKDILDLLSRTPESAPNEPP